MTAWGIDRLPRVVAGLALVARWSGDKALPPGTPASRDGAGSRLLALALFALACAGVGAMLHWAG